MDINEFWELIDSARAEAGDDPEQLADVLSAHLVEFPPEEIVGFCRHYHDLLRRAYHWNVMGPALILGCGDSDDGFRDFRGWLISMGREWFERVLADPESLVEIPADDPVEEWYFEFDYVPAEIYEEVTGEEMPLTETEDPDELEGEPVGESEEELSTRYPKLWSRFLPSAG